MAVAADAGDRFGSGEARFTVNKPLQAVPALPRFLSLGDQAQAAVTLHNNDRRGDSSGRDAGGVRGGAGRKGPARACEVPARAQRPAVFPLRATRPGKATFTFRAAAAASTATPW